VPLHLKADHESDLKRYRLYVTLKEKYHEK